MITSFFKNGLSSLDPIISSMQNSQTSQSPKPVIASPPPPPQIDKIVEQTLSVLVDMLSEKLGEKVQGSEVRELTADIMKSKALEANLIDTKERYNDLVNKSTNLYQNARKISNCVGEFITSINLFLESEELLFPLKEIQKGINELQPQKVEKQMNYLIKIFSNNFQELIDKNVRIAESNAGEEVKLFRNLNKNLQQEIIAIKGNKNNDQSKYLQQTMKITVLNQKIAKMTSQKVEVQKQQKNGLSFIQEKQKTISEQEKQIGKLKQRQNQLLQKIKQLQIKLTRAERQLKQHNGQADGLNTVIQKLKARHQQVIQQIESQAKRRQNQHDALRKKLYNQKAFLQEKNQQLNQKIIGLQSLINAKDNQIVQLNSVLNRYKEASQVEVDLDINSKREQTKNQPLTEHDLDKPKQQQSSQPTKKHKMSLSELIKKMGDLQDENSQIKASLLKEKQLGVNKQVLKNLFISYDDESKEWDVRRNIKYMIYSLLNMTEKLPKPQQQKSGKWFGLF